VSTTDDYNGFVQTDRFLNGKKLEVLGYPGEKSGFLYRHEGPIEKIIA